MTDTISVVKMSSIIVPNKAGEGQKVLAALKDAGVNLTAFWGYLLNKKQARLDLVAEDPKLLATAARKLKITVERKGEVFLANGEDRIGALEEPLAKLASAGINIYATVALCAGNGRYGALIHVDPADMRRARKALSR